jgi:hypothetical protein
MQRTQITFKEIPMKRLLTALAALMFAAIATQTISAQDVFPLAPWKRQEAKEIKQIDGKLDRVLSGTGIGQPPMLPDRQTGPQLVPIQNVDPRVEELHGLVKDLAIKVEKNGNFAERFAADKMATARLEPDSNKFQQTLDALKDAILHKAPDAEPPAGDQTLRTVLIIIGIVVAVFFVVTVCVFHLVAAFRQKADATAKANPDNQFDQKAAQFFDKLDDFNQKVDVKLAAQPLIGKLWQPGGAAGATAPATAADVQQAAVQGALVTGAINTALATPAPGQAVAATPSTAPAKATTGALPPATPPIHS